jgi:hypothetical protein
VVQKILFGDKKMKTIYENCGEKLEGKLLAKTDGIAVIADKDNLVLCHNYQNNWIMFRQDKSAILSFCRMHKLTDLYGVVYDY